MTAFDLAARYDAFAACPFAPRGLPRLRALGLTNDRADEDADSLVFDVEVPLYPLTNARQTWRLKVRLLTADADELRSPDPRRRARAKLAQTFAHERVVGQWCEVGPFPAKQGLDKYGRVLAPVWTIPEPGAVVTDAAHLVELGAALHAAGLTKDTPLP